MRAILIGLLVSTGPGLQASQPPLVEKYLHSGQLSKGELALEAALAASPGDDQIRFGLGVLKFVRAFERFGQKLHEYGVKNENSSIPFIRLPVPKNPDPAVIHYATFRRMLDDLARDLCAAEAVLARITDDDVRLALKIAHIRLDLDGDGQPTDALMDLVTKVLRQNFEFLKTNPHFRVCFDRGDVAWFRCYCHLLAGMIDFYLAFDLEDSFNIASDDLFARPKHPFRGNQQEKWEKLSGIWRGISVMEPQRLARFRKHWLKVVDLNRETWRHIRAETDNDCEWLPNTKQQGVIGLNVRDELVDGWLEVMSELEALLEGRKTLMKNFGLDKDGKGLNVKALLDDPPAKFVFDGNFTKNLGDQYFSDAKEIDLALLFRVFTLLQDTGGFAYAVWLN